MKPIFLFVFLFASISLSQIRIEGYVSDESGNLLPHCNITVVGKSTGFSSDLKGRFVIEGNFSDNDLVRFSYIGYENFQIPIEELNAMNSPVKMKRKVLVSQTVLIKSSIGETGKTPISFSKMNREEIKSRYVIQDIPEMLSYLPSTTFYSEGGAGIGYNYLSIRGFDQRRISVSINGIPQNDPEDHNVYWVDFPDLLESTELIQVQRGAGSGVIGYPAIGGSINIITSTFSDKPRFELSSVLGSYNTRKYSAAFSSGLIESKYSFYAKLSSTSSHGYRDNNWIDFKSYHFAAVRFDEKLTTQINLYGGPISDGLTYTGLPKFTIKDKKLRRQNFSYWEVDDNIYTYKIKRRVGEKEEFNQPHFELMNEYKISEDVTFNSAIFLLLGEGYFDYDASWADTNYLRLTKENGFAALTNPEDVIIRAMVDNKQWGWLPRVSIKHNKGDLVLGGEFRFHKSLHWGSPSYGVNLPSNIETDFKYYSYEGAKSIINFYAHENYQLFEKINILMELQAAYHEYKIHNEKFVGNKFTLEGFYINPRFGLNYKFNEKFNSYISLARVTREPRLKNYYDAAESSGGAVPQFESNETGQFDFNKPLVKPETMNSLEVGANYTGSGSSIALNIFYMIFKDEIVKKGQLDRFGQPITGNVDNTIHAGLELNAALKLNSFAEIIFNGTYSNNYISNGKYFIDSKNYISLNGNRINGFPDFIFNAILKLNYQGLTLQLLSKYTGGFYSDNYDNKLNSYLKEYPGYVDYNDNKVDAHFVSNLIASCDFSIKPVFKNVRIFLQVNNIFDELYAAYAVGKEFYPAAERHFITGIKTEL